MGRRSTLAIAIAFAAALPAAACQKSRDEAASSPDTPFHRDVGRICQAEERSGAAEVPEGARALHIAQYLAQNLESQKARDLMARLSQLPDAERGPVMRKAADQAGVEDCAIIGEWSGSSPASETRAE